MITITSSSIKVFTTASVTCYMMAYVYNDKVHNVDEKCILGL